MKRMTTNLMTMLNESIDWVKENKTDGCICPCCTQIAKVYKRKLNSGMAYELIQLYRISKIRNVEYLHHTQFARVTGGEISKLLYWGLVEEMTKPTDEKKKSKTSGYWKITPKGVEFVTFCISIPKHIFIFDAKLLAFSDETTTIVDALGSNFNYQELINGVITP
jgi:hypothetical protein